MANTTKAPTKAQIESELKETKNTLQETQSALQDAMELIAQLKEQVNQPPQVVVQSDKRANAKIKCIFLSSSAIFRKLQTHFIFYHKHLDYLQTLLVNKKQAHLKSALVLCFVVRITP